MRPEIKVTVIYKKVCDTLQPQDVATHYIWDSFLKIILDICSAHDFSKTVDRGQGQGSSYPETDATLCDPNVYPYTKFGSPASNNITYMLRTRFRFRLTDGQIVSCVSGLREAHHYKKVQHRQM